jgi:hypothetical protein
MIPQFGVSSLTAGAEAQVNSTHVQADITKNVIDVGWKRWNWNSRLGSRGHVDKKSTCRSMVNKQKVTTMPHSDPCRERNRENEQEIFDGL